MHQKEIFAVRIISRIRIMNIIRNIFSAAALAAAVLLSGCSSKVLTIEGVNFLIHSKSTSAEIYSNFANQASQDSLPNIAELFETASKSDLIHIEVLTNELKVLRGEQSENSSLYDNNSIMQQGSTIENLYSVKANSQYKVMSLLPEIIESCAKEKATGSQAIITQIMSSEEAQIENFIEAIMELERCGSDSLMVVDWHLCTKCGSISNDSACGSCSVAK